MRLRIKVVCLFLAGLGMLLAAADFVAAQTDGGARVASLSSSGYEEAHAVAFSPDGKLVAVGGTSGIYLFQASDLSRTGFIQTGSWARSSVSFPAARSWLPGYSTIPSSCGRFRMPV